MKQDWDRRARQNAKWYINCAKWQQADREFDQSGRHDVDKLVLADMDCLAQGNAPHKLRLLEIGCGIGRMTQFLADIFGEVYATDVSGEMVRRSRARLKSAPNVKFLETNGVDFQQFPDGFFDVIFSAFVYQHMPEADLICANISEAYRVLKPGGVFKFQTNGVVNQAFRDAQKDTWVGDTVPEQAVRSLAKEIGAQMMGIRGGGTQYCWTLWRKPQRATKTAPSEQLRIEALNASAAAENQEPATSREGVHHHLVVSGLDMETVDVNNLRLVLAQTLVTPYYVGPVRADLRESLTGEMRGAPGLAQVSFTFPPHIQGGPQTMYVQLETGAVSSPVTIEIPKPTNAAPRITLITNATDGGLDVYARGAKSKVRIFVDGINAIDDADDLRIVVGTDVFKPERVSFVPGNGLFMAELTLPDGIASGEVAVWVESSRLRSPCKMLRISGRNTPPSDLLAAVNRSIKKLIGR